MNLLDNEATQSYRFRTKNWVEINDDRNRKYDQKTLTSDTTMLTPIL